MKCNLQRQGCLHVEVASTEEAEKYVVSKIALIQSASAIDHRTPK